MSAFCISPEMRSVCEIACHMSQDEHASHFSHFGQIRCVRDGASSGACVGGRCCVAWRMCTRDRDSNLVSFVASRLRFVRDVLLSRVTIVWGCMHRHTRTSTSGNRSRAQSVSSVYTIQNRGSERSCVVFTLPLRVPLGALQWAPSRHCGGCCSPHSLLCLAVYGRGCHACRASVRGTK